jgi:hypothetical protein
MIPLRGPWRFVEPGYAFRLTSRVTDRYAGSLGLALLHWRIPHPTIPKAYLWDTRAILLEPGWQWNRPGRVAELRITAGPALVRMFEGPDEGTRGGAEARMNVTVRAGPLPLTVGLGWLWFSRSEASGVSVAGSDQHSIMLSAGIGY